MAINTFGFGRLTLRTQIAVIVQLFVLVVSVILYYQPGRQQHERLITGLGSTVINIAQTRGARLQVYAQRYLIPFENAAGTGNDSRQ